MPRWTVGYARNFCLLFFVIINREPIVIIVDDTFKKSANVVDSSNVNKEFGVSESLSVSSGIATVHEIDEKVTSVIFHIICSQL